MKLFILFIIAFNFSADQLFSQERTIDKELVKNLKAITKDFRGVAGVYVYHLQRNQEAGINADTIFPTASIIKVPILVSLFKKVNDGKLGLNDSLIYNEQRAYGGSGLMQFYKDSTQTDLRTLAALMITYSDNVTSIWNQELSGGGVEINRIMEEIGLVHTRVNSRTSGREQMWEKYGWGQTTPREMTSILIKIRNRTLISPAISDEMYRMMTNSFYTDYALSQIPPYIQTAAKQGMVDNSRSELVMVNAPHGDYVFYIATKNNKDQSWDYNNEAWKLQRRVSAFLWNYYEPDYGWQPAEGADLLVKGLKY